MIHTILVRSIWVCERRSIISFSFCGEMGSIDYLYLEFQRGSFLGNLRPIVLRTLEAITVNIVLFFLSFQHSFIRKSQSYTKLPIDKNDLWSRCTGEKSYIIFNQSNQNGIIKAHKCDLIDFSFHSQYTHETACSSYSLYMHYYLCVKFDLLSRNVRFSHSYHSLEQWCLGRKVY